MPKFNAAHLVLAALFCVAANADELNPARPYPDRADLDGRAPRVLVRIRGDSDLATLAAGEASATLSARTNVRVRASRPLLRPRGLLAMRLDSDGTSDAASEALARLQADPAVEYAEPDRRRYLHYVPDDPLYPGQWYLQRLGEAPSGVDAEEAWNLTRGSPGVVIAVLDTGVLFDHPDLAPARLGGRLLEGYDFISDVDIGNDSDGRDGDASDPGDWLTAGEAGSGKFRDCSVAGSSWHGTRVAGIVAAMTDNATGIAGGTASGWILPARVIGKCGGLDSDILAAMLWAGGLAVEGVPENRYPARVINLSLGSPGACPRSYQDVIDELATAGVLVVVSVGNDGGPVSAPANCEGVAAIAGLRHAGTKVGYSSLGPEVAVAAPAGNCVNLTGACLYSIDTTFNTGETAPETYSYTDQLTMNVGTSFSAPIVSAIAGLMLSVNGSLMPPALIDRLGEGAAKPFPVAADDSVPECRVPRGAGDLQPYECSCTTEACGAGMANAAGSVEAARRPAVAVTAPSSLTPGQNATLSAAGSAAACGHRISSYEWAVVDDRTGGTGIAGTDPAEAAIVVPSAGSVILRVTIVDDAGRQDAADVVVTPETIATRAPSRLGPPCLTEIEVLSEPVVVSISPSEAAVQTEASQSFVATVENTADQAVTWLVDGQAGGNADVGAITDAGVYTAPQRVPSSGAVTITAVSVADPQRSASALVTITPGSSESGGGAADVFALLLLAVAAAREMMRRAHNVDARGASGRTVVRLLKVCGSSVATPVATPRRRMRSPRAGRLRPRRSLCRPPGSTEEPRRVFRSAMRELFRAGRRILVYGAETRESAGMPKARTESELMTNIALGDEEAFVALYRHRQDDVYRFAYAFSHSLSIAQDVTQEVFLGVLENAARYDTAKGSVRAWLLGSARHLAINHLRRDRRGATKLPNGVPSEEHTSCRGEDEVFHEQRLARLHEEISRLPFEFRDALVLCDMMELSYADSAAAMQCPVGTVRSRLHRARALLAERLGSGASEGASGAMNTDPLAIVMNGVR